MMKRILLAEDDDDLGFTLKQYLELNNYQVVWAKDGEEALELFKKNIIEICILDVMMPKKDGFTVAKEIVQIKPEVPFLFLTARTEKKDRLKGLKLGADDYVVKPFDIDELLLRLNNIIRRTLLSPSFFKNVNQVSPMKIGAYLFDYNNLELTTKKHTRKLTKKEANLIYFIYQNKNQIIKRDAMLLAIWNSNDFFSGRSMDVFISRLRKYFKDDPNVVINSLRGIGLEFKILKP